MLGSLERSLFLTKNVYSTDLIFSIQQWGGGEYDEGVESNPDAEEYYIGLESGESLKHENLKQSHFDLASYTTESL